MESLPAADFSAVAFVRLADGTPAVAKLPPGGPDSDHEGDGLAAWAGEGAVRLLDRSADGVLLLERADPGHTAVDDAVVAATLARLWIEPPAGVAWRAVDDLTERWSSTILRWRDQLGPRLADAAIDALAAGWPAGRRLLHGDGHHANVLDGGARGWLAIDPQPLVGPPVLDLVPILFNGPHLPVAERIDVVARTAGVDADDLARVAVPRCVLGAAWSLDDDRALDPVGDRALDVARALL